MNARRLFAPFFAGVILASVAAGGAQAGLLDFLFGGPREAPRPVAPPIPMQQPSNRPHAPSAPRQAVVSKPKARAYCVRTCDGYYFATGFVNSDKDQNMQSSMCEASCGGGQMVLYTAAVDNDGSNGNTKPAIESAADAAGNLYTSLPAAYAFRNGSNPACTCQGTARGLPQIPISVDPTLRDGDIVVMPDGLKVFRGAQATPHEDSDFAPVAESKEIPSVVRQQVLSLQQRIATPQE